MWSDIFSLQVPALEKVLRTVLVYALIVLVFRIVGKRAIASLNTMDFVVMFLLSNVVQNAIIGNDNSFSGGAIGAVTLIALNSIVDRLAYVSPWFRRLVEGSASVLVHQGKFDDETLRRLGIRPAELEHAVRMQNGDNVSDISEGTMEPGGQLVLSLKKAEQGATFADIQAVNARLDRIEKLLTARG